MEVRRNHHSNVVCMYSRGPRVTHYLGLDGCELKCLQMHNDEFDREFDRVLQYVPAEYAMRYTKNADARKMIPISGSASRVLAAILRGQTPNEAVSHSLNQLEQSMTDTEATFRKPDGPVAQVHLFLDKKLEQIKAGKVSRKELLDTLIEKGYSKGTVTTQAGIWAKNNGVQFSRPAQAAVVKKAAAKSARAAKKKVS